MVGAGAMDVLYSFLPLALLVAYLWLQIRALRYWQGGWRLAAWLPAIAMVAATLVGVVGSLQGSNIAPIWIVFTLPFALLALIALGLVKWLLGLRD